MFFECSRRKSEEAIISAKAAESMESSQRFYMNNNQGVYKHGEGTDRKTASYGSSTKLTKRPSTCHHKGKTDLSDDSLNQVPYCWMLNYY